MNPALHLRVKALTNKVSKEKTLVEIIELLEQCGIQIKGNITNNSKRTILINSIRASDNSRVEKLLQSASTNFSTKENSTKNLQDLHGDLKGSKVEKFLYSGDLEEAVRVAFLRINNRVKKMSKLTSIDGATLMRSAFSKNLPKLRINSLKTREEFDEQEGLMHIFEGSMLAFRNPHSHDDEKRITPQEGSRMLSLANYLMEILDKVQK